MSSSMLAKVVGVDLQPRLSSSAHEPAVVAITHDLGDPGAGILAAISGKASVGSKECLLYDILGRISISA
jgi:hypothetical protein